MKHRLVHISKFISKDTQGLEIGPSHNPIAPKKKGFNVHILDHLNEEELREKYKDDNVDINNIEHVDFIWKGEDYRSLVGTNNYKWVIASHVIEHTPDLIGFLKECASVLEDEGILNIIVPDKRYCFDHFRPVSSLSEVIDAYLEKRTVHSPGKVADYFANIATKSNKLAWTSFENGEYSSLYSKSMVAEMFQESLESKTYVDLHSWCFTPASFQLLLYDLEVLGLIPFTLLDCSQLIDYEFHITLKKGNGPIANDFDRISLMKQIEYELFQQQTFWFQIKRQVGYAINIVKVLKHKMISMMNQKRSNH